MPVQAEITSPTICASTQTRIRPASPCNATARFQLCELRAQFIRLGSGAAGAAATVALPAVAADPLPLRGRAAGSPYRPRVSREARESARPDRALCPSARAVRSGAACTSPFAWRSSASLSLMVGADRRLALQNSLLHLEIIESARWHLRSPAGVAFCPVTGERKPYPAR